MRNQFTPVFLLALCLIFMASCAQHAPIDACVDPTEAHGFLHGLFQGFIAPVTVVLSIFMDSVTMYSANNSGWLYDLGFILGIGGFSGGILKSRRRRSRR